MFVIIISSEYTRLYRLAYVNPASMLSRATVDPPAKRHPHGVSIRWWPIAAHSYVYWEILAIEWNALKIYVDVVIGQ